LDQFSKNYGIELFTQKFVTKLSIIWVWDPGSEIRDPEKTYSRRQKGTGSRIRIRNTGFHERGPSYRRSLDPSTKVNIQYFITTFALLDPDPHSR
jgi:hypothetical protein